MDRVKTFVKYAIWIALFWVISDILIYFGINSTYKDIPQIGETPSGVEVIQMQSTKVNGRMKIKVNDAQLKGKVLKIDLYSSTGVKLATQYLEIGSTSEEIETYHRISEVKSYEITVVDEIGQSTEGFMDTALSTMSVLVLLIKLLVI